LSYLISFLILFNRNFRPLGRLSSALSLIPPPKYAQFCHTRSRHPDLTLSCQQYTLTLVQSLTPWHNGIILPTSQHVRRQSEAGTNWALPQGSVKICRSGLFSLLAFALHVLRGVARLQDQQERRIVGLITTSVSSKQSVSIGFPSSRSRVTYAR
jgi:hypothetical protein